MITEMEAKRTTPQTEKSREAARSRPEKQPVRRRSSRGTILHPTDYSPASRQAYELACQLAQEQGM